MSLVGMAAAPGLCPLNVEVAGGTSLSFTFTEKLIIGASGVVVRAYSASHFNCSR